jgi:PST family polysaccharide transporter
MPVVSFLQALRSRLRERHTLRAHFWQSLANYAQQGFGLIFGVILARILKPADFGAYGLAAASVALALLPMNWSLAPAVVADAGRTPLLYGMAAGFGWCIAALRLAIILLLAAWFVATGRQQMALLCLLIGFAESLREINNVQRASLESTGNFKPNFLSVMVNIAYCVAVVIPVSLFKGGPYALTLAPLGQLFGDFVVYRRYNAFNIFVKPRWSVPKEFFSSSFWLWINAVSDVALLRLDKWFIGNFRGEAALGYYNRAFSYAPLSHMLLNSFVSNPTVVGFARCETAATRSRLLKRTAAILFAGSAINWVVLFFFSRPIVLFLFGPQWENSVPIFQAFASLSLAYSIMYLPVTAMLAARRYREIGLIRLISVGGFALVLLLSPSRLSATSIAWLLQAVLIIQGLVLSLRARSFFSADT